MKKFIIYFLIIAFVIFDIYILYNYYFSNSNKLKTLGYKEESISYLIKNDIKLDKYYRTLDNALNSKYFNKNFINDYKNILYINDDNFINYVTNLLNKKYSTNEINKIYKTLKIDETEYLIKNDKIDNLFDYLTLPYFKLENINRYIEYGKKSEYDKNKIVVYVNIGIDQEFYSNVKDSPNMDNNLTLVNKYYALTDEYNVNDLVQLNKNYSYTGQKLKKDASENLIKMFDAAKREKGYTLWLVSGYRTKAYQAELFEYNIKKEGLEGALRSSAKANHSEHQTGLAADISNKKSSIQGFDKTDEYKWVFENAHKYGFIERYNEKTEFITGYYYEPWHYRYVGIDVASTIYKENITFEEYYVKYLNY